MAASHPEGDVLLGLESNEHTFGDAEMKPEEEDHLVNPDGAFSIKGKVQGATGGQITPKGNLAEQG